MDLISLLKFCGLECPTTIELHRTATMAPQVAAQYPAWWSSIVHPDHRQCRRNLQIAVSSGVGIGTTIRACIRVLYLLHILMNVRAYVSYVCVCDICMYEQTHRKLPGPHVDGWLFGNLRSNAQTKLLSHIQELFPICLY